MYKILLLVLAIIPSYLFAQKPVNQQIDFIIDNDAFLGPADKDRYYSSGIFLNYLSTVGTETTLFNLFNKKDQLIKLVQGFHFSQLVYTSDNITFTNVNLLDRPYAGIHALGYSLTTYRKNNWVFTGKLDLGILGPSSLVDEVQINWHNFFGLSEPRGWIHQINDTPYANLKIEAAKSFVLGDDADLIYESTINVGTVFNNIKQGATLRIGNLKKLINSGYKNGLLGALKDDEQKGKKVEGYFFVGSAIEYVFYNSTIEGNFIGRETAFIDKQLDWIWHWKFGFNLHWQSFDFGYHINLNSRENKLAGRHAYGRILLSQRF